MYERYDTDPEDSFPVDEDMEVIDITDPEAVYRLISDDNDDQPLN